MAIFVHPNCHTRAWTASALFTTGNSIINTFNHIREPFRMSRTKSENSSLRFLSSRIIPWAKMCMSEDSIREIELYCHHTVPSHHSIVTPHPHLLTHATLLAHHIAFTPVIIKLHPNHTGPSSKQCSHQCHLPTSQ